MDTPKPEVQSLHHQPKHEELKSLYLEVASVVGKKSEFSKIPLSL